MKTLFLSFVILLVSNNKIFAQEDFTWQPENSFHATAMHAFHGAEMNKLQPARDSAIAILSKAEAWKNAVIPADYNTAEIKPLLQTLYNECKAINDAVIAKKPDDELKPLVLKAHETFHQVINKTK
jgi:hypothetical protein